MLFPLKLTHAFAKMKTDGRPRRLGGGIAVTFKDTTTVAGTLVQRRTAGADRCLRTPRRLRPQEGDLTLSLPALASLVARL